MSVVKSSVDKVETAHKEGGQKNSVRKKGLTQKEEAEDSEPVSPRGRADLNPSLWMWAEGEKSECPPK